MRDTGLSALGALTTALLLSGCSGHATADAPQMTSSPASPSAAATVPATGASPLPVTAPGGSPSPLVLAPSAAGESRAPVRLAGTTDAGLGGTDRQHIDLVYDAFLSDFSGLLDYLSRDWLTAIGEVSTSRMTTAAAGAASAVQQAKDHGIGSLVDSHRAVRVSADTAQLSDCLDELHWYVVENASGRPDPSVTRGYFVGTASFVRTEGQWKLDSWNSHPERCTAS